MFNHVSERTFCRICFNGGVCRHGSGSGFCRNTADVFKAEWERSGYGKTDVLFFVYASMWCANFTTWYIICYVAEKFIPGLLADVMPLIGLVSVAFGIGTVEK